MPLIAYDCRECETNFEKLVPAMNSGISVQCPNCDSKRVDRQLAMPAKPISAPLTNCAGDGPPCGKAQCGRMRK